MRRSSASRRPRPAPGDADAAAAGRLSDRRRGESARAEVPRSRSVEPVPVVGCTVPLCRDARNLARRGCGGCGFRPAGDRGSDSRGGAFPAAVPDRVAQLFGAVALGLCDFGWAAQSGGSALPHGDVAGGRFDWASTRGRDATAWPAASTDRTAPGFDSLPRLRHRTGGCGWAGLSRHRVSATTGRRLLRGSGGAGAVVRRSGGVGVAVSPCGGPRCSPACLLRCSRPGDIFPLARTPSLRATPMKRGTQPHHPITKNTANMLSTGDDAHARRPGSPCQSCATACRRCQRLTRHGRAASWFAREEDRENRSAAARAAPARAGIARTGAPRRKFPNRVRAQRGRAPGSASQVADEQSTRAVACERRAGRGVRCRKAGIGSHPQN